jgi:hypothetical protein
LLDDEPRSILSLPKRSPNQPHHAISDKSLRSESLPYSFGLQPLGESLDSGVMEGLLP